jgi:hypothetical protein
LLWEGLWEGLLKMLAAVATKRNGGHSTPCARGVLSPDVCQASAQFGQQDVERAVDVKGRGVAEQLCDLADRKVVLESQARSRRWAGVNCARQARKATSRSRRLWLSSGPALGLVAPSDDHEPGRKLGAGIFEVQLQPPVVVLGPLLEQVSIRVHGAVVLTRHGACGVQQQRAEASDEAGPGASSLAATPLACRRSCSSAGVAGMSRRLDGEGS